MKSIGCWLEQFWIVAYRFSFLDSLGLHQGPLELVLELQAPVQLLRDNLERRIGQAGLQVGVVEEQGGVLLPLVSKSIAGVTRGAWGAGSIRGVGDHGGRLREGTAAAAGAQHAAFGVLGGLASQAGDRGTFFGITAHFSDAQM